MTLDIEEDRAEHQMLSQFVERSYACRNLFQFNMSPHADASTRTRIGYCSRSSSLVLRSVLFVPFACRHKLLPWSLVMKTQLYFLIIGVIIF